MLPKITDIDLTRLNSLTKYPSIPTYHALDPKRGGLLEEPTAFPGDVLLTEKIDGTNARVVCLPGGAYIIGSRGEFLLARGDLIGNPALGIVDHLRDTADRMADSYSGDGVRVYFGEVYGGRVTQGSKQYTGHQQVGYRLFDVADIADAESLLTLDPEAISQWREAGGQSFINEAALGGEAERLGLELTPRLGVVPALPESVVDAAAFLQARIPESLSCLDDSAGSQAEGIVARSMDRTVIAKMRFDDYRRTLKRRAKS